MWQEIGNVIDLLGRQARERVLQIRIGIESVELGRLCRPQNYADRVRLPPRFIASFLRWARHS